MPTPTRAEYFARWSLLHGGYDPASSRMVGGWLSIVHACSRPFVALRVPPDALTFLGVLVTGGAVALASVGGRWSIVAALVVVLAGLADSLDGAVAVMTDRVTRWGAVIDGVADRISDALFVVALWFVGAPDAVCLAAAAVMLLQEYLRARATAVGMDDIGVVTLWERPTRIIVTAMFLLGAGIYATAAEGWATAGAWAWVALGVIGFIQLAIVVRRRLSSP